MAHHREATACLARLRGFGRFQQTATLSHVVVARSPADGQAALACPHPLRHPSADRHGTKGSTSDMNDFSLGELAQRHLQIIRAHYDNSPALTGLARSYRQTLAHYYNLIIPAGASVLEIGGGGGDLLALLNTQAVHGIDLSEVQIKRARQAVPHGQFSVQAGEVVDLGGKVFDYIVISDTLNLTADVQQLFKQLHH